MRRIFFVVMLSLIASAVAYAQHFKFMGIELDSAINNFDVQIKQKGFQNSKRFSSFNTSREKWYDGFFAGYDVGLLVRSSYKTDRVYVANIFRYVSEEEAIDMTTYIKNAIKEKYVIDSIIVQSPTSVRYKVGVGDIIVDYEEDSTFASEGKGYRVDIIYFDIKNNELDQEEKKSDI